jgi:YVTN family beta-propeller protein
VLDPGVGCVVSTQVERGDATVSDGSFDLEETLIVEPGGRITVPVASGGNSLTINLAGDLIVLPGGGIVGDASGPGPATGVAATLRIAAAGSIDLAGDGATGALISSSHASGSCTGGEAGTIVLEAGGSFSAAAGSVVAANSRLCRSGDIVITAAGRVRIDGLVASGPSTTVTPRKLTDKVLDGEGPNKAGEITIRSRSEARPGITIGPSGIVVTQAINRARTVSRKVLLEGCGVIVDGGDTIAINGADLGTTGPRQGHVRAAAVTVGPDTSDGVDLLARGDVIVTGPRFGGNVAVASNPIPGNRLPAGGNLRAISLEGRIQSFGNAFEAGSNDPGNLGGSVALHAAEEIHLDGAIVRAVGAFDAGGDHRTGGRITVRSFGGAVSWHDGIGDVRPTGTGIPEGDRGTISVTACSGVDVSGAAFPHVPPGGEPTAPTITRGDCTQAGPVLPPGADPLPLCPCTSSADCDDGDTCNGFETCDPSTGRCQPGGSLQCDDADVCNGIESCDPTTGCQLGTPLACDDANACNGIESCDPATGCQLGTPLACDDANACNGIESCDSTTGCQLGTPLSCDDANACNGIESCDPVTGCRPGIALRCDDGNACNGVETCHPQAGCRLGTPPSCDDGDTCNGGETCDPRTGCVPICALEAADCSSSRLPDGTPCGDGDACNGEEICQEGSCIVPSPEAAVACANASLAYVISNFEDGTVSIVNDPARPTIPVGRAPWGVAIHPLRSYVYVTNRDDNTLSVIETATWTVTTTVPVGQLPLGVAVDPRGDLVYVTSFDDDTITMVDTSNHTVIGRVPAGPGPAGLAFNAAGTRLYVTNFAARTVSVFDPATSTLIDTLTVGEQPLDITLDPVYNRAYVSNFDSRNVSVIGLLSSTILTTLEVGNRPFGIGVSGPLGLALVTNGADDSVSVIDTPTSTVIGAISLDNRCRGGCRSGDRARRQQTGRVRSFRRQRYGPVRRSGA